MSLVFGSASFKRGALLRPSLDTARQAQIARSKIEDVRYAQKRCVSTFVNAQYRSQTIKRYSVDIRGNRRIDCNLGPVKDRAETGTIDQDRQDTKSGQAVRRDRNQTIAKMAFLQGRYEKNYNSQSKSSDYRCRKQICYLVTDNCIIDA